MQTIAQAFATFMPTLELTEAQSQAAIDQHTYLREQLQQRMDVEANFLSGSYARKTAVRPLNDIDVFLVLTPTRTLNTSTPPPKVLAEVKRVLEEIYAAKVANPQARSVNIEFTGTRIAYDVVPAFAKRTDVYTIPDADASNWIETNPKIHKEMSTAANELAAKKLKPLLKALKHANNRHGNPARSFHLEVLTWNVLTGDPGPYMDGLVTLLDGLARRICDPCPDPAGLGADIRPAFERCEKARTWLGEMAALAREAKQLSEDGRTGEAHFRMRKILGEQWPEAGTSGSSRSAAVVVAGGSVDHSGSRFG